MIRLIVCGLFCFVLFQGCGGEITLPPQCRECPDRCLKNEEGQGKCVACLTNDHCRSESESTRKCNKDNRCICGSNQDCPEGRHCNGTGGCVECLSDENCKSQTPERPFCQGFQCFECKTNEIRACAPEGLSVCTQGTQTCKSSKTWGPCEGWVVCKAGEVCKESTCVPDCGTPACKDTERRCLTGAKEIPGRYQTCQKDNKGCFVYGSEQSCAEKEVCNNGKCEPYPCPTAECTLDSTQCAGSDSFRTCIKDKYGCLVWSDKQACKADTQCHADIKRCTRCKPKATESCYSGNSSTKGKGECKVGQKVCADDGSGFGACQGETLPQNETCNGKDDDCNGSVDDSLAPPACTRQKGLCNGAKQTCQGANGWKDCDTAAYLTWNGSYVADEGKQHCDGKDNDCDGTVDESCSCKNGDTQACYNGKVGTAGKGICKQGQQTCTQGTWGPCIGEVLPTTETCNNKDDNCDGSTDENLEQTCYTGQPSNTQGKGECKAGKQTCSAGQWGSCVGDVTPQTETCNGKDDNCDGSVDESNPGGGGSCTLSTQKGECAKGTEQCQQGKLVCVARFQKVNESCDNLDNDCDGLIDNNLTRSCYSGTPSTTQGKGECKAGIETCTAGQWGSCVGEVIPQTETCNGKDDNCDGSVDENLQRACYSGTPSTTQGKGECKAGTQTCTAGQWGSCTGEVTPQVETCNNKDDNCDGMIDDGNPGGGTSCVVPGGKGKCAQGTQQCKNGAVTCESNYKAQPEVCDLIDNDCDGTVDESCPNQWLVQGGQRTNSHIIPQDIAVDSKGNVFVSGTFQGPAVFGSFTHSSSVPRAFVASISPEGKYRWVTYENASSLGTTAGTLAVDQQDNIYVALDNKVSKRFGGCRVGTYSHLNGGSGNVIVMKLNQQGKCVWFRRIGGLDRRGYSPIAIDFTFDPQNNLVIGGAFYSKGFLQTTTINAINPKKLSLFVSHWDTSGKLLSHSVEGELYNLYRFAIAAGNNKQVALLGTSSLDVKVGAFSSTAHGNKMYIIKFDGNGKEAWTWGYASHSAKYPESLAMDSTGSVYATGMHLGPIKIGTMYNPKATDNLFVAKFSPKGAVLWATTGGGPHIEYPRSIKLDSQSNVYLSGYFEKEMTLGTKTLRISNNLSTFVAKLNGATGSTTWLKSPTFPVVTNSFAQCFGLALDKNDNYYLFGNGRGAKFGTNTISTSTLRHLFVTRNLP